MDGLHNGLTDGLLPGLLNGDNEGLINGQLVGNYTEPRDFSKKKSWQLDSFLNSSRNVHSATKLQNGNILVSGGWNGSTYNATSEIYNPNTKIWTQSTAVGNGNLNTARGEHEAILLNDGRVLISGGLNSAFTTLNTTEIYDPATGVFTVGPNMNSRRRLHSMTLLLDGRVLITGGDQDPAEWTNDADIFNPTTNLMEVGAAKPPNMTYARRYHKSHTLLNGNAIVIAGRGNAEFIINAVIGDIMANFEIYDPIGNTWTLPPDPNYTLPKNMFDARQKFDSIELLDGRVLAFGGSYQLSDGSYTGIQNTEIYDPKSNRWQCLGKTNLLRGDLDACLLSNGNVLMIGGNRNGTGAGVYTHSQEWFYKTQNWGPLTYFKYSRQFCKVIPLNNGTAILIDGGPNTGTGVVTKSCFIYQ